eukprot:TRINITY_DN9030_c0_g1_i4.p1 TRINITY_DN9030_c0_g1~~TRINITY_DN9030_c0_g1_i4.p1  ORF type:complete len:1141 (+),score=267.76 TRINITY_DN9030_c0_g1_i4:100-3423(+)
MAGRCCTALIAVLPVVSIAGAARNSNDVVKLATAEGFFSRLVSGFGLPVADAKTVETVDGEADKDSAAAVKTADTGKGGKGRKTNEIRSEPPIKQGEPGAADDITATDVPIVDATADDGAVQRGTDNELDDVIGNKAESGNAASFEVGHVEAADAEPPTLEDFASHGNVADVVEAVVAEDVGSSNVEGIRSSDTSDTMAATGSVGVASDPSDNADGVGANVSHVEARGDEEDAHNAGRSADEQEAAAADLPTPEDSTADGNGADDLKAVVAEDMGSSSVEDIRSSDTSDALAANASVSVASDSSDDADGVGADVTPVEVRGDEANAHDSGSGVDEQEVAVAVGDAANDDVVEASVELETGTTEAATRANAEASVEAEVAPTEAITEVEDSSSGANEIAADAAIMQAIPLPDEASNNRTDTEAIARIAIDSITESGANVATGEAADVVGEVTSETGSEVFDQVDAIAPNAASADIATAMDAGSADVDESRSSDVNEVGSNVDAIRDYETPTTATAAAVPVVAVEAQADNAVDILESVVDATTEMAGEAAARTSTLALEENAEVVGLGSANGQNVVSDSVDVARQDGGSTASTPSQADVASATPGAVTAAASASADGVHPKDHQTHNQNIATATAEIAADGDIHTSAGLAGILGNERDDSALSSKAQVAAQKATPQAHQTSSVGARPSFAAGGKNLGAAAIAAAAAAGLSGHADNLRCGIASGVASSGASSGGSLGTSGGFQPSGGIREPNGLLGSRRVEKAGGLGALASSGGGIGISSSLGGLLGTSGTAGYGGRCDAFESLGNAGGRTNVQGLGSGSSFGVGGIGSPSGSRFDSIGGINTIVGSLAGASADSHTATTTAGHATTWTTTWSAGVAGSAGSGVGGVGAASTFGGDGAAGHGAFADSFGAACDLGPVGRDGVEPLETQVKHVAGSACCALASQPEQTTRAGCCKRCVQSANCEVFSWQPSTGTCWLLRWEGAKRTVRAAEDRVVGDRIGLQVAANAIFETSAASVATLHGTAADCFRGGFAHPRGTGGGWGNRFGSSFGAGGSCNAGSIGGFVAAPPQGLTRESNGGISRSTNLGLNGMKPSTASGIAGVAGLARSGSAR